MLHRFCIEKFAMPLFCPPFDIVCVAGGGYNKAIN